MKKETIGSKIKEVGQHIVTPVIEKIDKRLPVNTSVLKVAETLDITAEIIPAPKKFKTIAHKVFHATICILPLPLDEEHTPEINPLEGFSSELTTYIKDAMGGKNTEITIKGKPTKTELQSCQKGQEGTETATLIGSLDETPESEVIFRVKRFPDGTIKKRKSGKRTVTKQSNEDGLTYTRSNPLQLVEDEEISKEI